MGVALSAFCIVLSGIKPGLDFARAVSSTSSLLACVDAFNGHV